MRVVMVISLLGCILALVGVLALGWAWTTALAIWVLSGPLGALLALLLALTPLPGRPKGRTATSVPGRAA
jgi:hypothetical protein